MMVGSDPAGGGNTISGGTFLGPVLQGRDFRDVGVDVTVRAAAAAPVVLVQLPAVTAGFTGRDGDLRVLAGLLDPAGAAGPVVVSAVAGLAGVGKTTLAVAAGHAGRQRGWFGGGVLFIDLHGYDEAPVQPGQALDALLRALGVAADSIPAGAEERATLYRSKLAARNEPVLIIADNASSEAQVRLLLPGSGPHRVVVTSRHILAGLSARLLDVAVLDTEAGVALLETALQAARPDDERIRVDRPGAARLAEICGGLPLALQITAALLKAEPARTISELAEELADEMRRLKTLRYDDGSETSAPSVAAAFELSYRQLDQTMARVFRLLPVNPGPDVSTAAVAVLADLPASDVRRVLGRLFRAHLVDAAGTAERWRMHDLLRLYARELSDAHADADGREQALDRLLRYYLETARAADGHLRALRDTPLPGTFTGRPDALAWLDAERPSLVATVTRAATTGRDLVAMLLPVSLAGYLSWRRRFDDLLATALVSRDVACRLDDRYYEATALNNLGSAYREARQFEEGIAAHQDAAVICRETGDRHGEGMSLDNLGVALREVRRFDEAITAHQDAAAIFRDTGDRHGEGMALTSLGIALAQVRRFEEAITTCQDAAVICQETDDRHGEGMALGSLGLALRGVGRGEEAIAALQDVAAIFQETGDRHREGRSLNNLGLALADVRRVEEAIAAHQGAVVIFKETGDRHGEGMALNNLGIALARVRRFEEAITTCQDAAAIYRETGDRHGQGTALNNLGVALREVRLLDEAIAAHQEDLAICRETGDRHGEATALDNLGLALQQAERRDEGITAHQDAAAIFRETGDEHAENLALENLDRARAAPVPDPDA